MTLKRYPPHPILKDYVHVLWASTRDFQPPGDVLEILPDSYVELVFSFGAPCQIDDGASLRPLPQCYLIGFADRPLRLRARGIVTSIAARLYLWGLVPLLGLDMPSLSQAVHLLDSSWSDLTDQIGQAMQRDDSEAAISHLHDFLIQRAHTIDPEQKRIQRAAQQLFKHKGQAKISELAGAINYSQRHLERKFKQSVGTSPKALARRIRFEKVRNHLTRDPGAELSGLAHDYGYADQAHLIRDFRAFSGKTPAQFALEMTALRQAMQADYHVVFLQY
jgi:AraC-like DNA-binding protein